MVNQKGNRRKTINIEEDTGIDVKDGVIQFMNGNTIIPLELDGRTIRGDRANFISLVNEDGDIIEMDIRDGSYRILYKAEESE